MFEETVLRITNDAVFVILLLSAPVLIAALATGLLISIFQATTQLQEMTLVFVPKIIVVFLVLIFFGPWMLNVLVNFTSELIQSIPMILTE
ncbi:MAG: flagellar biosynthesis protein FliQ [Syntrophomonadaceae bacterium]|nr:flagellar biosynthesis protein FliQ [Syntrophomonadaceae bacterium]